MMKPNDIEIAICHEWGHALMWYLVLGSTDKINSIEIVDNLISVQGHTKVMLLNNSLTTAQKAVILFGGIVAENICGYSKTIMHRGTDAYKLRSLIPDKSIRNELRDKTLQTLSPYDQTLKLLTEQTLLHFPKERDTNGQIYFRLFHDDINMMFNQIL